MKVKRRVAGPVGGPPQRKMAAPLQDPVADGLGEIGVVEDPAPGAERLVRGEEHRAVMQVPLVDDVEEDVGRVGAVGEVAHLVDDEHVGVGVGGQDVAEAVLAAGGGQLVDEGRDGGEARLEAVLDGAVGEGDGQVGFPRATRAAGDQAMALRDELGAEEAAAQGEADTGLEGEVELLDGLEEGEAGAADAALDAGLGAVGDLLGKEQGEEVAVAEAVLLGARDQVGVQAPDGGQVQAVQEGVEVDVGAVIPRSPGPRRR